MQIASRAETNGFTFLRDFQASVFTNTIGRSSRSTVAKNGTGLLISGAHQQIRFGDKVAIIFTLKLEREEKNVNVIHWLRASSRS